MTPIMLTTVWLDLDGTSDIFESSGDSACMS